MRSLSVVAGRGGRGRRRGAGRESTPWWCTYVGAGPGWIPPRAQGHTSVRQALTGCGGEYVLFALTNLDVDLVALHRHLARVGAHDHLRLAGPGGDVVGDLLGGELGVDEGVRAQFLDHVNDDRERALLTFGG